MLAHLKTHEWSVAMPPFNVIVIFLWHSRFGRVLMEWNRNVPAFKESHSFLFATCLELEKRAVLWKTKKVEIKNVNDWSELEILLAGCLQSGCQGRHTKWVSSPKSTTKPPIIGSKLGKCVLERNWHRFYRHVSCEFFALVRLQSSFVRNIDDSS